LESGGTRKILNYAKLHPDNPDSAFILLLYEPDSERIEKLKNSLKKQYPLYCELLQKIDESFYSK